jgi:hypothetical protein
LKNHAAFERLPNNQGSIRIAQIPMFLIIAHGWLGGDTTFQLSVKRMDILNVTLVASVGNEATATLPINPPVGQSSVLFEEE